MEAISTFDIFKIGIGPSSSHTMGPWRAAQQFLAACRAQGALERIAGLRCELYGSLAKTGKGHGTDLALVLGLAGEDPVTCDPAAIHALVEQVRVDKRLRLAGEREVPFDPATDIAFRRETTLPFHPNGLRFVATLDDGSEVSETYYSIGGGFVVQEKELASGRGDVTLPYLIETADDLLRACRQDGQNIPQLVRQNELAWRTTEAVRKDLMQIWQVMQQCVFRGCQTDGVLPGGLGVVRRAAALSRQALGDRRFESLDEWLAAIHGRKHEFRDVLKWVSCFALAVNEENAAFGRVVTAPTNGAAGVVPAVLLYYTCFCDGDDAGAENFLLTAAMIGTLFKRRATLSAAMGGCQAEIGVSSAMAAAGLTQVLGGSVEQVLMAAEIAMEHHLGLTCDPVGGLVQVPCIERNTMGAVKAITACNLALAGDPAQAKVTLDAVIRSMWATAQDMNSKYKETSEGGLAMQIPVNVSEC